MSKSGAYNSALMNTCNFLRMFFNFSLATTKLKILLIFLIRLRRCFNSPRLFLLKISPEKITIDLDDSSFGVHRFSQMCVDLYSVIETL
jgi:hypothetical protein